MAPLALPALLLGLLIALGGLLAFTGGIIDLVQAFQTSVVWGLLYLFVPFASLVFIIKFWSHKWVRNGFLMSLLGTLLIFGGLAGSIFANPELLRLMSETSTTEASETWVRTEMTAMPQASEVISPETAFPQGVRLATLASEKAQTAKSKEDWASIAQTWQQAIEAMQAVPDGDPNFAVAQKKVAEYQKNLNYAQQNAQKPAQ